MYSDVFMVLKFLVGVFLCLCMFFGMAVTFSAVKNAITQWR